MEEINITMPDIEQRNFMVSIYENILHKDNKFHMFPEGVIFQIRCDSKFVNKVVDFAEKWKIYYNIDDIEIVGDYIDPNETVQKYQDLFEQIFHAQTVLACEIMLEETRNNISGGMEAKKLYERIIHLAYITLQYPLRNLYNYTDKSWVEPTMLASATVERSMYNGMYAYVMKDK